MSIQHTARTGKVYCLHVGQGKSGKPNFFFSKEPQGKSADNVPEGFEIYENIRGQVFLRRKVPQVITDEELALVEEALVRQPKGSFYLSEVKKNAIVIYEAEDKTEYYRSIALPWISEAKLRQGAKQSAYYQAVMRFVLVDEKERLFSAERFCFRGSVDDWNPISMSAAGLSAHLKKFVKHLGQKSIFELY